MTRRTFLNSHKGQSYSSSLEYRNLAIRAAGSGSTMVRGVKRGYI